jgi:hypothetical protein
MIRQTLAAVALCGALLGAACGDSPTKPTPATPQPPTPVPTTPPFTSTGLGKTSFDIPSGITKLRIRGEYSGNRSQFIVLIGNRLVVNEPLGTDWGRSSFEVTQPIVGTFVDIAYCEPTLRWTLEEVR